MTRPNPASVGYANVLTFMLPPGQRERAILRLNAARRRNLALREPGWIDADPPTWRWDADDEFPPACLADGDPLAPARGVLRGVALSVLAWLVIILIVVAAIA
jgi:hypothetical protein